MVDKISGFYPTFYKNEYIQTKPNVSMQSLLNVAQSEEDDEGLFSKFTSALFDNNFVNSALILCHLKKDYRYKNMDFEEKQRLNKHLLKSGFDIGFNESAIEKIDSFLQYVDMNASDRNFQKAQQNATQFAMKNNYSHISGKGTISEIEERKLKKSLSDDNKLLLAMTNYVSENLSENKKAKLLSKSAKTSVSARKEAFELLQKLVEENPTTKENIEKFFAVSKISSEDVAQMLLENLESVNCDEKLKENIIKQIKSIKNNVDKEFKEHFNKFVQSKAWKSVLSFSEKMKEYAKADLQVSEKKFFEQKEVCKKKTQKAKIAEKNLEKIEYTTKKLKNKANAKVDEIKCQYNFSSIPVAKRKDVLKNTDINMYKKILQAQSNLKSAKDVEYDAKSDVKIAETILSIDSQNMNFALERYAMLS